MGARLRSWWQQINTHPVRTILIALFAVVIVLVILSILGYIFNWDWTGLVPESSEPKQHAKTLWDWLQLLIIPAVLAVAGYIINLTISKGEQAATEQRAQSEREAAEKRAQVEREIARDARREAAFPDYIDKVSELLFERNLLGSQSGDDVRIIARVRTLAVLRELDADRKGSLLRFLYEAHLINKDVKEGVLNLTGADLSAANLSGADMSRANLSGADLGVADLYEANLSNADLRETNFGEAIMIRANLSGADLMGADLSMTDLSGVDLRGADLSRANLHRTKVSPEQWEKAQSLKGATMPDGTKHP